MKFTERQQEYVDAIIEFVQEYRRLPSIRDIGYLVGVSSSATVFNMLQKLRSKGFVMDTDAILAQVEEGKWTI